MLKTLQETVNEFIEHDALKTSALVFYPPGYVVELLGKKKIIVNKMYIVRRYEALGIKYDNGLWVRKI